MKEYAAALDRTMAPAERGNGAGSIDALVASYFELVLPILAKTTQKIRRGILVRFCHDFGRDLVVNFETKHVSAIINAKAATPHAANNLRKVLRHLFKHAVRLDWRKDNPSLKPIG